MVGSLTSGPGGSIEPQQVVMRRIPFTPVRSVVMRDGGSTMKPRVPEAGPSPDGKSKVKKGGRGTTDGPEPSPAPGAAGATHRGSPGSGATCSRSCPGRPLDARQSDREDDDDSTPDETRRPVLEAMRPRGGRTRGLWMFRTEVKKG
jgi:hypothetical protein